MTYPIRIETPHLVPSVNSLYANVRGKGRVRTEAYKRWALAAGYDFAAQTRGKSIKGLYELSLTISRAKARSNSDLSNRIKGAEDLLVEHGVVEDDKHCAKITVAYGDCEGMILELWPWVQSK